MIPALTCLLLPYMTGCSAYVRDVPAISAVLQNRAHYTDKVISVTGHVRDFDEWRSHRGRDQEFFAVCSGGCIHVFMYAHSPIRNGELVTVSGHYYQAFRTAHNVYRDEIEATQVLPRE